MSQNEKADNTKREEEEKDIEKCNFNAVSQNVKGLREKIKRLTVFEHLKKKGDIIFLQESHSTPDDESKWKEECEGEVLFSHGASNARGVMIIFSKKLELEIVRSTLDKDGRYIIVECLIQGTRFLIWNIYAPNNKVEHKSFLSKLKEEICENYDLNIPYKIGIGDWNFTEETMDRLGGNYTVLKESVAILEEINEKCDMVDIWRIRNPDKRIYTWRQKKPIVIHSRIDRIYISDTMQYNVFKTDIIPGIRSDHSAVTMSIKPTKGMGNSGPSFWKFNNSLLKNENFTTGLKSYIETELAEQCESFQSKQVKWEYMKYKIKTWSIAESKKIARQRRKTETELQEKIKDLEEKSITNTSKHIEDELDENKAKLEKIYEEKIQGLIIQSRVQHYEEGEKSTKFFLNQIKQNKQKSTIRKIIEDNHEITEEKQILMKLKTFYSKLYERREANTGDWIKKLKENNLIPQLTTKEKDSLEAPLEKEDLKTTMKKCAKNKSPGNDGLTQEFYEYFWNQISEDLYQSFIESEKTGKLSTSQRQNIISLLEKVGKDKTYIKNWRPISLINFDTKLLSKTYAERLKEVMPSLVHPNQVAYIKNRFIGEGIRTIDEILHFTKKNNLEAYAIAIDFEKAFDSVDWNYMWEALDAFNIPKRFIDVIKTLYNDIESCVTNNGTSTPYFKIERGVRQGDPIAAYLFTIAIELLAIYIRENKDIQGIQVNNTNIKLSMYADDMTGLVIGISSITHLMTQVENFKQISGLGINQDKTELMPLGSSQNNPELKKLGYKIVDNMKVTGVVFTYDKAISTNKNFRGTLINIDKTLSIWKQRNLSLLGKIQIIKTYAMSPLLFMTTNLTTPDEILKEANTILFKFLWNGPDKVKRAAMIGNINDGGIKMPHLESVITTQKLIWVKRFTEENFHPWKEFMKISQKEVGCEIYNRKVPIDILKKTDMSNFNKEILIAWNKHQKYPTTPEEIGNQYLWHNENIKTANGKTIFHPLLSKSGINYVKDLLHEENIIHMKEVNSKNMTILEKFNMKSTLKCIPSLWKTTKFTAEVQNNFEEASIEKLRKMKSKTEYKNCIEKIKKAPNSEAFFTNKYNITSTEMKECYSIPFRSTIYTKLRSFQFKINHNILYTRAKLHQIGIKGCPNCYFCKESTETLDHLFIDCKELEDLWENVKTHLLSPYGINSLKNTDILLGINRDEKINDVVNHILLETKYYIYTCSLKEEMPIYRRLKYRIKMTECIERNIALKKKSMDKHSYKWNHLIEYLIE